MQNPTIEHLSRAELREAIRKEYKAVALKPQQGFHFHTGPRLAGVLEYDEALLDAVPASALTSFAGTGNPFAVGRLLPGERVIDLGCGAGTDSFIAAEQVGRDGSVLGIDMTPEMIGRARIARSYVDAPQLRFRMGFLERLPVPDGKADVVISNGVLNLCPDKRAVYREIYRALRPGGRIQIADILIQKPLSEEAKMRPDLWTG